MNDYDTRQSVGQITPSREIQLLDFVHAVEASLTTAGTERAAQAFNLGCSITLPLAAIITGLVLWLSNFNWIEGVVAAVLSILLVIGFCNLVAMLARRNAIKKTYQERMTVEIDTFLRQRNLTRADFNAAAQATLPENAVLRTFTQQ
jgi:uncharacterized membrane protein YkvI